MPSTPAAPTKKDRTSSVMARLRSENVQTRPLFPGEWNSRVWGTVIPAWRTPDSYSRAVHGFRLARRHSASQTRVNALKASLGRDDSGVSDYPAAHRRAA